MNATDFAKKANEIFVLSDSFIRIKELIDDEASTIDDIADVILIDPALAATILKLANSSFFNYPGKIDTISKAVLVLGITEVYNLVIAYFTTEAFKAITAPADYLEEFWERSVDCALLVKYLGGELKVPKSERLFILGLLHNIGELVVQQFSPDQVEEARVDDLSITPWDKQRDVFGFSFGDCSGELLKVWQLPYSLIEPIRNQDDDDLADISKESSLLFIAKRIMLHSNQFPKEPLESLITEEQLEMFSLKKETIKAAIDYCNMERLGVLSVLKPSATMIY